MTRQVRRLRQVQRRACRRSLWLLMLWAAWLAWPGDGRADADNAGGAEIGAGSNVFDVFDVFIGAGRGFAHHRHTMALMMSWMGPIDCRDCHTLDRSGRLRGRPGHDACFGRCHGPPPKVAVAKQPRDPARQRLCVACHRDGGASKRAELALEVTRDYRLHMPHAVHVAPSGPRGCTMCHRSPGTGGTGPGFDGHVRCISCHSNHGETASDADDAAFPAAFSIRRCTGCHISPRLGAETPPPRPQLERERYAVRYDHRAHGRRGAGPCEECHEAIAGQDGARLPAPKKQACVVCHREGSAESGSAEGRAFAMWSADCRRCHLPIAATGLEPRPQRGPGYDHGAHLVRGQTGPCTDCHAFLPRAQPDDSPALGHDVGPFMGPPSAEHGQCASAECHRDDFASRTPAICGACHLGTEPWLRLYYEPPVSLDPEFGVQFSHRAHQGLKLVPQRHTGAESTTINASCTRCHGAQAGRREMAIRDSHGSCSGDNCHRVEAHVAVRRGPRASSQPAPPTPPAPNLNACDGCHVRGLLRDRIRTRTALPWSTRSRFRHEPHRTKSASTELPCVSCHADVTRAEDLQAIAGPAKATCEPCHNGIEAFKITGHECVRCHDHNRAETPP